MKATAYRVEYGSGRATIPLTPPIVDPNKAERERIRIAALLDCPMDELVITKTAVPVAVLPEEDPRMIAEDRAVAVLERPTIDPKIMEQVIINGDLSKLSADQRLSYYERLCDSLGINPLSKPFAYLNLNGKLTLYALKDCTDQLRTLHQISITDVEERIIGDLYVVKAHARNRAGREDVSSGTVNIKGLGGEGLANATMKAETKAKRRVTLSICGLGMLDESEADSIPGAVSEDWRERYRRKFFAVAEGTQYASDEGRAKFIGEFTRAHGLDPVTSLRAFLSAATEDDAIALIRDLELATQDTPFQHVDTATGEITETDADEMTPAEAIDPAADIERFHDYITNRGAAGKITVQWDRATAIGDLLGAVLQSTGKGIVITRFLIGNPTATYRTLTAAEADGLQKLADLPRARERLLGIHALAEAWLVSKKRAAQPAEPSVLA